MKSMHAPLRGILFLQIIIIGLLVIGCKKNDPKPPVTGQGRGSLTANEYGGCLPSTVHGIFYNGIDLIPDSSWVDISVKVSKPGNYTITTDKINGVTFSASGIFNDTGLNFIRLKGAGRFTSPGNYTFPTSLDSTHCSFDIEVRDSAGLSIADNTWEFTAGNRQYRGAITKLALYQLPQSSGYSFEFEGWANDTLLSIGYYQADAGLGASHPTSEFGAGWGLYKSSDNYRQIFGASPSTAPNAVITIAYKSVVTTLHPYGVIILGTFDGAALDSAQKVVPITNSRFKYVEQ